MSFKEHYTDSLDFNYLDIFEYELNQPTLLTTANHTVYIKVFASNDQTSLQTKYVVM